MPARLRRPCAGKPPDIPWHTGAYVDVLACESRAIDLHLFGCEAIKKGPRRALSLWRIESLAY